MDWSAKLFGLGDQFLCKSKVGGGVIQVGLRLPHVISCSAFMVYFR